MEVKNDKIFEYLDLVIYIVYFSEYVTTIISALNNLDEFNHSSLWYICSNGFTSILEALIDNNEYCFGISEKVIESVIKNTEEPSPLWIATFNGHINMVEMLKNEPFSLKNEMNTISCGITPSMLASLNYKPGLFGLSPMIENCEV